VIDWNEIIRETIGNLGKLAHDVDASKAPKLVRLCGVDRRLIQDGPIAMFEGGMTRKWEGFSETYKLSHGELTGLTTPHEIVDHIMSARVKAGQAVIEKIEEHITKKGYDLGRTRCITLIHHWLRETVVTAFGSTIVTVPVDCVCAFGPWTPCEADEPAIAGKAGV
jgi:hypothetical protein